VKVIGAGFGRTGTLSLKRALEQLGFGPTYHMEEVVKRPSHVRQWHRFATDGVADWDRLFAGFGSGVDFPVSCVWRELAEHYPDAKVVLTVRDPERWWESTATTIYGFRDAFPTWFRRLVPLTQQFRDMTDRLVWNGIFDGRLLDRDHAVSVFERHVAEVQAALPPDRLLTFDVAEGWEPLCDFLGVPAPSTPFPKLNDAATIRRRVGALQWGTRSLPVVAVGAALAAGRVRSRR
jgi:hypothetical protein